MVLRGLPRRSAGGAKAGGIFSVPLIRQVALPGRYPAPCPAEFGLSSPPGTSRNAAVTGSSDRLTGCDATIIAYRAAPGGQPSTSCLIPYCSSFLYRLLRGVSMISAVFEMFQFVSRSFCTR